MKKIILGSLATIFLLVGSFAFAGHHYHGHGCSMKSWDMSELDTNGDGDLTFEEYLTPHQERLRNGFNSIDKNDDGMIDQEEWRALMEVHGLSSDSKS